MTERDEIAVRVSEAQHGRELVERQYEARLATLAEFDVIKLQSARRVARKVEAKRAAHRERSTAILQDISQSINKIRSVLNGDLQQPGQGKGAKEQLERAKMLYKEQVEKMYPSWQEQMERETIRRIRSLKKAKETLNRRRELAKAAFEKEQSLRSMVAEQEYDVKLIREQERREQLEREMQRINTERAARERARANFNLSESKREETVETQNIDEDSVPSVRRPSILVETSRRLSPQSAGSGISRSTKTPVSRISPMGVAVPRTTPTLSPDRRKTSPTTTTIFELSYDWQEVPLGRSLPSQTEQKLSDDHSTRRMARIPPAWQMRVKIPDLGLVVDIPVSRLEMVQQIIKRVLSHSLVADSLYDGPYSSTQEAEANLYCNGKLLDEVATVEQLGATLFMGSITMDISRAETDPLESKLSSNSGVANTTSTNNWKNVLHALQALTTFLQREETYRDLRGCKYGLIGPGSDQHDANMLLVQFLGGDEEKVDYNTSVESACLAVLTLLKNDATGLFPIAELVDIRLEDMSGIQQRLDHFFDQCSDERDMVWETLVNHWQWLIREHILSREELAKVFVPVLLGEDSTPEAQFLRNVLKELTSSNVVLSRGSIHNASSSPKYISEDDDDEENSNSGYDASRLAVVGSRLRDVVQSLDDDDDENEDDVDITQSQSKNLEQFLKANQPVAAMEEDEDIVDDDEFDF